MNKDIAAIIVAVLVVIGSMVLLARQEVEEV